MTIIKHELKQGRKAFIIWTVAIVFLVVICVFMFPEMESEMSNVNNMFSSMGSFTKAFGMDKLNFGTFIGFYAIECGNVLGLGGAFFAALIATSAISNEEREHTAEFLLTHPVSRSRVITEKLISVLLRVIVMNVLVWLLSVASVAAIDEKIPWKDMTNLHLAYLIMQVEICGICFGISAFLRRGSVGVGIGIATMMYFLNIIANISDSAELLKYITPFSYTEGADIVADGKLSWLFIAVGISYAVIGIIAAYVKYRKKDIVG